MCTKRSRKITFQAKAFQLVFFFVFRSYFVQEKQPNFGHSMPQWLNSTRSRTAHNLYYARNRETNNEYTREYYEESDCRHLNEWTNERMNHWSTHNVLYKFQFFDITKTRYSVPMFKPYKMSRTMKNIGCRYIPIRDITQFPTNESNKIENIQNSTTPCITDVALPKRFSVENCCVLFEHTEHIVRSLHFSFRLFFFAFLGIGSYTRHSTNVWYYKMCAQAYSIQYTEYTGFI